jgi:hypothetical protein
VLLIMRDNMQVSRGLDPILAISNHLLKVLSLIYMVNVMVKLEVILFETHMIVSFLMLILGTSSNPRQQ